MELRDLAIAHLQYVSQRIEELRGQQQQIDSEISRLTNILQEGSKLVNESTVDSDS